MFSYIFVLGVRIRTHEVMPAYTDFRDLLVPTQSDVVSHYYGRMVHMRFNPTTGMLISRAS